MSKERSACTGEDPYCKPEYLDKFLQVIYNKRSKWKKWNYMMIGCGD
jgi:hypothetical protein